MAQVAAVVFDLDAVLDSIADLTPATVAAA
jgi:hypothetical protein